MLRIGFAGIAHMHAYGYSAGLKGLATVSGVWDHDPELAQKFSQSTGCAQAESLSSMIEASDAVIITSENLRHLEIMRAVANAGKPMLCEKPIVTNDADAAELSALVANGARIMTAFPCRYSPAFQSLRSKVSAGEIGTVRAICATNRGRCPWSWFVDPSLSGGGAMIDHVVHVTDLLRVLLGCEVTRVQAQTGNNMYAQEWEDTAMLTLEFENGVFATLDSSWSRHATFKTWGDVTMNVVGDGGVIEIDLFGQTLDFYHEPRYSVAGYGSDIDAGLVADFLRFAQEGGAPPISADDGIRAARVAWTGYESARKAAPIEVPA